MRAADCASQPGLAVDLARESRERRVELRVEDAQLDELDVQELENEEAIEAASADISNSDAVFA